ncbi:DUF2796 domain-containing protein [uncultured Shimia sp.]|uniref:zinc uptake protein ZrgA n=1 Tax=uncultured Shimia sp. TaxID=573152 RepID=UPI00262FBE87|nr:DUF2796 domain-containing protein [uncultured Shimia sp.]
MKKSLPIMMALLATPVLAEGTRELDSHEHGVGELNIAFDGDTIAMEFHAPGADIVGFEYEAQSAEDRASIDAAVAALAKPLELFVMPAAAECSVVQASAGLESEDAHEEHDAHEDEHEEHADDHAHDHEDDHDDDHADADGHTEFHAEYELTCGNPNALSDITFAYFGTFENARELEVQIVSASGAQAFEVERDNPKLDLRGMF